MLAEEHREEVITKVMAFLTGTREANGDSLTPAEIRTAMESFTGEPLTDREFRYRQNFLALEEHQFGADWSGERPKQADDFRVVVIGAGFSGIAMGVQLERLGIPYVIYERRDEVGGTWSINTYPDARVDTSSFTYQFTFEKQYPWSEFYARGADVRAYIENVAKKRGILDKIVFNAEVSTARFDAESNSWKVADPVRRRREEVVEANIVVSGTGLFGVPKELDTPGIESFQGSVVHTTAWPPAGGIKGKNVAIIGNGSTGVQLLSQIASEAGQVYVHQRTPQWIAPREGYGAPVPDSLQWLLQEMPYFWNWYCYFMFSIPVRTQALHEYDREWQTQRRHGQREERQLFAPASPSTSRQGVGTEPDLYERLIPKHAPMARRLIVDNSWYNTLLRDNVDLVTDPITEFTPDGIRTADGTVRPVDVVVAAVGFAVNRYLWPVEYVGPEGISLEEHWDTNEPMAYLGTAIPEFPNLFVLYGPNSQARTGSLPSWIEIWSRYVARSVVHLIESGKSRITVEQDAFEQYNKDLDAAARELVWDDPLSRGRSYYLGASGDSS